jgi:hypothetical protein
VSTPAEATSHPMPPLGKPRCTICGLRTTGMDGLWVHQEEAHPLQTAAQRRLYAAEARWAAAKEEFEYAYAEMGAAMRQAVRAAQEETR